MEKPKVILIVEAKLQQRLVAMKTARALGFDAVEASDADEAIRILEARPDIRLIVSDVHMRNLKMGVNLARYIRHRKPPVTVIGVGPCKTAQPGQLALVRNRIEL